MNINSYYVAGGCAVLLGTGGALAAAFGIVTWPIWVCALIGIGTGGAGGARRVYF